MTRKDALRQCGIWIAVLVAAAAYFPRFAKDSVGMVLYPQGAECVLQGAPLNPCAKMFSYPPVFAFLMAPFAAMPMGLRVAVWYVISVAATVGCFMISEKLVLRLLPGRWSDNELAWLRIVTVIVSIKFVLAVFEWQAYDTLTYFIVLAGLWAVVVNRAWLGAAALALAAAIKATPLVFLPYLVLKRRFLAAGLFIVVFVVGVCIIVALSLRIDVDVEIFFAFGTCLKWPLAQVADRLQHPMLSLDDFVFFVFFFVWQFLSAFVALVVVVGISIIINKLLAVGACFGNFLFTLWANFLIGLFFGHLFIGASWH